MAFTMRSWKNICSVLLILISAFLCLAPQVNAEIIKSSRAEAQLTQNGQLRLNTRFNLQLPRVLSEALEQGIALDFKLEFELDRPFFTAYKMKLGNWFASTDEIDFKLSYHSLTNKYRLAIGGFSNNYTSLNEALRATGAISGWQVLESGQLNGVNPKDIAGRVRLTLNLDNLPKPFQLNALGSVDWSLASGWINLKVKAKG